MVRDDIDEDVEEDDAIRARAVVISAEAIKSGKAPKSGNVLACGS